MSAGVRARCIVLVLPSLERGGSENVMLQLARLFLDAGRAVHVVALLGGGPWRARVPKDAILHELVAGDTDAKGMALARRALPGLVGLLRDVDPDAVLSTLTGTNLLTALAHRRARGRARLVLREASSAVNVQSVLRRRAMRWLYRRADAIVAVSTGVAQDLRGLGLAENAIHVIHNPVDAARLRQLAETGPRLDGSPDVPYIVALGRLTAAKDYPTLLQAYAASALRRTHRLAIVGEGDERARLEAQARALGVADRVLLPGALDNPYRVLSDAALFVLSSRWEGYPNALLEALVLQVPAVSTDCPHGPREILAGGRYGRLAPVAEFAALARAMDAEITHRSSRGGDVVAAHAPGAIAARYLALLDARDDA